MNYRNLFKALIIGLLSLSSYADETESRLIEGIKYSYDKTESVSTKAFLPNQNSFEGGFNELLSFVIASPYQDNAGSCLFMSHTGAVEILLNQSGKPKVDLSERYFMNLQKSGIGNDLVSNWRTDTIYRLNKTGVTYRNEDFRFTKGWYKTSNGVRIDAAEEESGAYYGVRKNWVVDLGFLADKPAIKLQKLERDVLFADPSENQWNVGTAPSDIVSRVKEALRKNKAPVIVIYNHLGFWHANIIVGFNDHATSNGCPFISTYDEKMNKRADEIVIEANEAETEKAKRKLLKKAAKFRSRGKSVQDAYVKNGSCSGKGVFYVRDSIYPQKSEALYDFDLSKTGEEEYLNAPVILREYEWLERVSNNVIQIRFK